MRKNVVESIDFKKVQGGKFMSNTLLNSSREIEDLLRSLQVKNEIPCYICYWADGSVTKGSEYEPARIAMGLRKAVDPAKILVGLLNPYGQFSQAWSLNGEYTVTYGDSGAYLGEEKVVGLYPSIKKMVEGQGAWYETKAAEVEKT